jgi:hypothetical protein
MWHTWQHTLRWRVDEDGSRVEIVEGGAPPFVLLILAIFFLLGLVMAYAAFRRAGLQPSPRIGTQWPMTILLCVFASAFIGGSLWFVFARNVVAIDRTHATVVTRRYFVILLSERMHPLTKYQTIRVRRRVSSSRNGPLITYAIAGESSAGDLVVADWIDDESIADQLATTISRISGLPLGKDE